MSIADRRTAGFRIDIREIGYITYLILAVALVMETVATQLKKRYNVRDYGVHPASGGSLQVGPKARE